MTDHPPVCSYEGSDYQDSFWDKGNRAYEDAAEATALRRLLPPRGKRMLELGAGTGRNTLRYQDFKKIVLLDYSTTQLEKAYKRLGVKNRYCYVAADIYRLPFMPGSFDCATMIRTLHHMVNPSLALSQVHDSLIHKAVFILEYANKRNIKAILRYWLKKQVWNPFSLEPVEFAPLNFDFHPNAVRDWMTQCQLIAERQLTVSHFRLSFLKNHVSYKVLARLDALLQPTGQLFQLSPSVFLRAHAEGELPVELQDSIFKCPNCGHGPLEDTPPQLKCPRCRKIYPVKNGIYDFRLN
jgi:SAM-dependent methyltransferase